MSYIWDAFIAASYFLLGLAVGGIIEDRHTTARLTSARLFPAQERPKP